MDETPFCQPATKILKLISKHQLEVTYKTFLKNTNNYFVGSLRKSQTNNIQPCIVSNEEYNSLQDGQYFVSSEFLTPQRTLAKTGQEVPTHICLIVI